MSRFMMISNFVLFQAGWFACVLGGANNMPLLGSVIAVLIISVHLWRSNNAVNEFKLIGIAVLIGLLFESILVSTQLAHYRNGMFHQGLAPYWMILMWPVFATTLNVSMQWVKQLSTVWLGLLGALFAPLAYLAGARLNAVAFDNTLMSLSVIAIAWAVLFPALVECARHFDGYADFNVSTRALRGSANV